MSEDVDFKIVPAAGSTGEPQRPPAAAWKLGDQVTAALHAAGFAFDPKDEARTRSRNENRYTIWQLPYENDSGAGEGLRPTIQIETDLCAAAATASDVAGEFVHRRGHMTAAGSDADPVHERDGDRGREAGGAHPPHRHGACRA